MQIIKPSQDGSPPSELRTTTFTGLVASSAVVVDMSSSVPARTRELARTAAERGITLIDAPVSGGVAGAYDSGFGLRLMLKDMRIALQLEQEVGVPAPLGQAAVAAWAAAAEDLPTAADHTEIARWLAAQIDQSRESERPLPIADPRSGSSAGRIRCTGGGLP